MIIREINKVVEGDIKYASLMKILGPEIFQK